MQFQPEAQVSEGSISFGEPPCPVRPQLFPGSLPQLAEWLRSLSIPFGCLVPEAEGCSAAEFLGGKAAVHAPRAPSSGCSCAVGHPTPRDRVQVPAALTVHLFLQSSRGRGGSG